jgi:hypothetical protein
MHPSGRRRKRTYTTILCPIAVAMQSRREEMAGVSDVGVDASEVRIRLPTRAQSKQRIILAPKLKLLSKLHIINDQNQNVWRHLWHQIRETVSRETEIRETESNQESVSPENESRDGTRHKLHPVRYKQREQKES